jgi:hypothetical protein
MVVVVVVEVVVVGRLILMVGPPLLPQASVNDTMAMLVVTAKEADRQMFRTLMSPPVSEVFQLSKVAQPIGRETVCLAWVT